MPQEVGEGYRFLEHTTDAIVEAWASTLEDAFSYAARGFYETMLNYETIEPRVEEKVTVEGHDEKELLYNWLEALLLKFDLEAMVYAKFDLGQITTNANSLKMLARLHGEKYSREKHGAKAEVKGVTYHLMRIDKIENRVVLQFLLDL